MLVSKVGNWLVVLALLLGLTPAAFATQNGTNVQAQGTEREYIVVYAQGMSASDARKAVQAIGGTITKENSAVGVATVKSANQDFLAAVARQSALFGATRNTPVGQQPNDKPKAEDVERMEGERQAKAGKPGQGPIDRAGGQAGVEPLTDLQWDMKMINALEAHKVQAGDKRVLVGILDTGVDGSHPDIAPNFNAALSRNFTTDVPLVDGACADDPDGSCSDPANVDENGHGTHVASTIASPINGLGIAGVAPNVTIVNIRAGQDSGYFFLQPSVDALTYAGDIGVDVVNMSYYIDPWLYNCVNNPADSAQSQLEQRTIIEATQRALDYARKKGVTLIAAEGNGHTDLGNPQIDDSSPDFPPGAAYTRQVNNSCLTMPTEGNNVIGVTSVGPSGRKAYYSDYGIEQADIAAPGGDYYDGTPGPTNLILAAYPQSLAIANGELNPDGTPNTPFVVRDCQKGVCAYYQYLQGTSMAAPHATGVAALIISQYGQKDGKNKGGLTLNPVQTEKILYRSAMNTACPEPRLYDYPNRSEIYNAYCEGTPDRNGFYGEGIVDALNAVSGNRGGN